MKKVLLIVAAILLANAVSAQNHEKNILGVRAGLNLSSYSISESGVSVSTDSRAAFHVAVSDQILLCDRLPFYLETGLAFSSRGGKLSGVSFRPSYLQIPVLVNYHFNIKNIVTIQPFAGLYYGLGIGGNGTIFMKVALSGVAPAESSSASGTYNVFRDMTAPFGVASLCPCSSPA